MYKHATVNFLIDLILNIFIFFILLSHSIDLFSTLQMNDPILYNIHVSPTTTPLYYSFFHYALQQIILQHFTQCTGIVRHFPDELKHAYVLGIFNHKVGFNLFFQSLAGVVESKTPAEQLASELYKFCHHKTFRLVIMSNVFRTDIWELLKYVRNLMNRVNMPKHLKYFICS